ncbi:MAG: NADH-quinone oxidoreductase subunit C [Chloroflexi bacterium]|nr:NADH-quinone oxidoreductase subunit C [Chloroflexota bacterium]
MTRPLSAQEIEEQVARHLPQAVVEVTPAAIIVVRSESLPEVARLLKETPGLGFDYLVSITGVDYLDYFEVTYHLVSLEHNHSLVLKTRVSDRDDPAVPSVVELWRAADFQEREVYDLMGIRFSGHPNLKRLLLWEGFAGHPLRRDYL